MISFSAGPSKVHDNIPRYLQDACDEGILSINHRSKEFMSLCRFTFDLLKRKLDIPGDYSIFFTSSATEGWEIIAQSLTKTYSSHLYNGAFGQKWFQYAQKLNPQTKGIAFDINQLPHPEQIEITDESDIICLTQNETSNGSQIPDPIIFQFREHFPDKLLAIDATSSMGGIYLGFQHADIWFASVQKCFGLPAGLGLLICSPAALEQARKIGDRKHYNSLLFMADNAAKFQTHYTPNVLGIYLLMRSLKDSSKIEKTDLKTKMKSSLMQEMLFGKLKQMPLVENAECRSDTVLAIKVDKKQWTKLAEIAKKEGFILGGGYGEWKEQSFRIANFPQHSKEEHKRLGKFLQVFFS
jgi:phosphoserine aminotransferase